MIDQLAQLEVQKTLSGASKSADVETIDLSFIYGEESASSSHVSYTTSSQHSSLQSTGSSVDDSIVRN